MLQSNYKISAHQIKFFNENGYLLIEDIITPQEVHIYSDIYDSFLDGGIDTGKNRGDLGAGLGKAGKGEAITQIMWPSDFMPQLLEMSYHKRILSISRDLLGEDMAFDFDMLISRAPETNTPTPWHQDAS